MLSWLVAIGGIIFVDLVLSGDNALVIGAAAAKLPRRQRLTVIAIGGAGAVILRVVFAALATYLLQLPLLGLIGGAILLYIAIRLLLERSQEHVRQFNEQRNASLSSEDVVSAKAASRSLLSCVVTIIAADVTMSLDNVLAVGAIAAGNLPFLIAGLLFSIVLLMAGSALVAELIGRLPWLLDIACVVLAWSASQILLGDDLMNTIIDRVPWIQIVIPIIAITIVVLADIYLRRQFRLSRQHNI